MTDANVISLISYDDARTILDAAVEAARANGVALSFAVVDGAGHIVASARMDGAPFITTEVARGKAFACVATGGQPGRQLRDRYLDHPMVWGNISSLGFGAPLLPAIGSEPIWRDGKLIGAMSASGGAAEMEEEIIQRSIETIGASVTR